MQKFLAGLFAIGVMFLFSTPVAISGQLQHPCDRMMAGPERTAWNAANWDISPFLSNAIEYRDMSFYTFGYTFGYIAEQCATAALSAGTVTVGKLLLKNGVSMIGKLAPRTLGMLAIRFHFIKEALASLNLADDSVRLAYDGAMSSAGKQPTPTLSSSPKSPPKFGSSTSSAPPMIPAPESPSDTKTSTPARTHPSTTFPSKTSMTCPA